MLFNVRNTREFLGLSVLYHNKSGSLFDTQLFCKIGLFVGIYLGIFNAGLVEGGTGYFAVGAGGGHKEQVAVLKTFTFGHGLDNRLANFLGVFSADNAVVGQLGSTDVVNLAVFIFLGLAVVPVLNRTIVSGNTAVYLGGFSANGALFLLARKISVAFADRIGGGNGVVGKLVILGNLANEGGCRLPVGKLFT